MTALASVAVVCVSVLLLAWWARGVLLTWLAEGQALEQVAQLRAELVAEQTARGALEARISAIAGTADIATKNANDAMSIALAAKTAAHLGRPRG